MKIKVKVTKEDIENGSRDDPDFCPVARALHRATGKPWQVRENASCENTEVPLPNRIWDWIEDFDSGDLFDLTPIEFELDIPEPPKPRKTK